MNSSLKPVIALFTGDPAGIGPELTAKLLADPQTFACAEIVLIGNRATFAEGIAAAGASIDLLKNVKVHPWSGLEAPAFAPGEVSEKNGRFMLDALTEGAHLVQAGKADALCFAPLNKGALRAGGMHHEDEMRWFAELLAFDGICGELNVLEKLWTSRVTSHVPLREVSSLLSVEKVADAIRMITEALRAAGNANPRIAVCGLNPHNGDNGNYGDEEARIIGPGVQLAASRGFVADGPFSADTAFVRAIRADGSGYDGVVTMYHDQGQIAMKLMGFERGVTVQGGLPIPITTPAHGTAYDIVGKGVANPQAMKNAFDIACRMGRSRQALSSARCERHG
jgi:4-hydroxy-L-threonine phosphate dehydrogenase PdxA